MEPLQCALVRLFQSLPRCSGLWHSGSGAHRVHMLVPRCERVGVWDDEMFHYCDEHVPPAHIKRGEAVEHVYAEEVREIERLVASTASPERE